MRASVPPRSRRGTARRSGHPRTGANSRSAVAIVTLAMLAGCTNPLGGSAAPETPTAASVASTASAAPGTATPTGQTAWFDQVCAAGITVATPTIAIPSLRGNRDLTAVKQALLDYLDSVLTGIRQGRSELDAAGPSPVAGGDQAVARARTVLDELERSVTDARAQAVTADPNDPRQFATTVGHVRQTLVATKAQDTLREILATPGLADAAAASQQCAQLKALVAAAPR